MWSPDITAMSSRTLPFTPLSRMPALSRDLIIARILAIFMPAPNLIVHIPALIYCVISRLFAPVTISCHHGLLIVMLLDLPSATALETLVLRMVIWLH
jgi:hypothetical protein